MSHKAVTHSSFYGVLMGNDDTMKDVLEQTELPGIGGFGSIVLKM